MKLFFTNILLLPYFKFLTATFLFVMGITFFACQQPPPSCNDLEVKHYIHLGHTRIFDTINQVIDPRIEKINIDPFDMVLLGGDLCEETSKRYDILEYIDGLFDVKNPNTLWAIGNHDDANLNDVNKITGRPTFYSYHKNNITFVVLYSVIPIDGKQIELLKSVTDTISESSHLIVMTHNLLWLAAHPEMADHRGEKKFDWSCNYRASDRGWKYHVLPLLRKVMKKDIQVIALAGDIGNNKRVFEERTKDGIYYLASGNNPKNKDARFLHFKHHVRSGLLSWKFEHLEDFLKNKQQID